MDQCKSANVLVFCEEGKSTRALNTPFNSAIVFSPYNETFTKKETIQRILVLVHLITDQKTYSLDQLF